VSQAHLLGGYFALFYAAINSGSLISILLTPKLRADVQCFGLDECFPLAFGIPAALMAIATIFFVRKICGVFV
jgi:dipeptide/tripeptide permease